MVWSTTTLFKGIPCPGGDRCKLTNCIYGHDPQAQTTDTGSIPGSLQTKAAPRVKPPSDEPVEPALKRRKVTYDTLEDKPPSRAEKIKAELAALKSGKSSSTKAAAKSGGTDLNGTSTSWQAAAPHVSLFRPVSPPPSNEVKTTSRQTSGTSPATRADGAPPKAVATVTNKVAPPKKESLNPRMLNAAPEAHGKRTILVQHVHGAIAGLNRTIKSSTIAIAGYEPAQLKLFVLTDQEMITLTLDEEEKIATTQPKVYANVMKNRIAAYKKMNPVQWINDVVKKEFSKSIPPPPPEKSAKVIETGLDPDQELQVVRYLTVADQTPLKAHGYIPSPPTEVDADEAAKAVEASRNYEECVRCAARFQVFPDRNEDGKLTSNGPCTFHPLKKVFPTRQKTDAYTGGNQPYYPCCMGEVGSTGCTTIDDHVFKTSSPARLAAVLPFVVTPHNPGPAKDKSGKTVRAVTFDCEMGYTALGLELIRLTAVSWPSCALLVDVLVRPQGTIIDLNSRFSGVWPEHFANAIPYYQWNSDPPPPPPENWKEGDPPPLPVVDSPKKARELLCSYLTPSTPLIGHAIENDLNTTRICHPSIIDTMLLYPHPRGLPFRYGLKMLSKKYLERDIQTGGDRGHDSLEDAQATGDLVRVKVKQQWAHMKATGWKFDEDGRLVGPEGGYKLHVHGNGKTLAEMQVEEAMKPVPKGGKRRASDLDGADDADEGDGGQEGHGRLSVDFLEK